jgi:probable HAF family extracellular repeat protein
MKTHITVACLLPKSRNGFRQSNNLIAQILLACAWGCMTVGFDLMAATITWLGELPDGSSSSRTSGVSDDGQVVVGSSMTEHGERAFRWTPQLGMQLLDELPGWGFPTSAAAVSGNGQIVAGMAYDRDKIFMQAYRWSAASGTEGLGDIGGESIFSVASAVSADGAVIVGWGTPPLSPYQWAVLWMQGRLIEPIGHLGGHFSAATAVSADGSAVAGWARLPNLVGYPTSPGTQAFLWTRTNGMQALGDLEGGGISSCALGVSTNGPTVVGWGTPDGAPGSQVAFRWTPNDGLQSLGDLPGGKKNSVARAITADGNWVVGQGESEQGLEAVLWDSTQRINRLWDRLVASGANPKLAGWERLVDASSISRDGRFIAGHGIRQGRPVDAVDAFLVDLLDPGELPLMKLELIRHDQELWLAWPAVYANYSVQMSDRLGSDAVWKKVVLRDADGQIPGVVLKHAPDLNATPLFFRLAKPEDVIPSSR